MPYYESNCTTLLTSKIPRPYYGAPFHITTTGARDLPRPVSSPFINDNNDIIYASPLAFLGIFEQPHGSGINPYLLVSTSLVPAQQSIHEAALKRAEPPPSLTPWRIRWFGRTKVSLRWNPNFFVSLSATVASKAVAELWDIYGDPNTDAQWLAATLMPRRRGSTIIMPSPTLIQLWVRLF